MPIWLLPFPTTNPYPTMNCIKQAPVAPGATGITVDLVASEEILRDTRDVTCVLGACKSFSLECDKNITITDVELQTQDGDRITLASGKIASSEDNVVIISTDQKAAWATLPPNTPSPDIENPLEELVDNENHKLVLFVHKYIKGIDTKASLSEISQLEAPDHIKRITVYKKKMLTDNEHEKMMADRGQEATIRVVESHPVHCIMETDNISINGTNMYPLAEGTIYQAVNSADMLKCLTTVDKYLHMKLVIKCAPSPKQRILTMNFKECPCMEASETVVVETTTTKEVTFQELLESTREQFDGLNTDEDTVIETIELMNENNE